MIRLLTVAIIAGVMAAPVDSAPQQVFRTSSDVVSVFVTVTDRGGRLVTDLAREDFQIFDNGKPQPVSLFDNSPQPIRVIALIDLSGSMGNNLPLIRRACVELIAHLATGDLARVGTFGQDITMSPSFTTNVDELISMLPASIPADAPTPLWRAADQAMTTFNEGPQGRKVILVLSDGKDSGPQFGKKYVSSLEVIDRAQREDVMVYGIGLRSAPAPVRPGGIISLADALSSTLPDPALGTVAIDTGGGYFELRGRDDVAAAFARVADELHRQYLLGFAPPARDGKVHKIEVKLRDGSLKPLARKSYVAPK